MINEKELSAFIENKRREYEAVGMAVAVTDRETTVFAEGFGSESIENPERNVTPQTLFKIASVTKLITGITVMKLVENGVMKLDVPIKQYVPWLTLSRPEAAERVTLRHLLTHSAGLSSEIRRNGPKDERYLEEMLRGLLPELEMFSLPGDNTFLYSNYGFVLAAYTAQCVTGKQYSHLATESVLMPLGMHHTFYDLGIAATYPMALPHRVAKNGKIILEHSISSDATRFGSGEVFSTVTDLCKLMRLFMNRGLTDKGKRLLREETVNLMLSEQIDRGDGAHHGLSVHIRPFGDTVVYGHTGYWPPYRTSVFFDPKRDCGVVTMLNMNKDEIRDEIMAEVFRTW